MAGLSRPGLFRFKGLTHKPHIIRLPACRQTLRDARPGQGATHVTWHFPAQCSDMGCVWWLNHHTHHFYLGAYLMPQYLGCTPRTYQLFRS
jgi:hypothetical protein